MDIPPRWRPMTAALGLGPVPAPFPIDLPYRLIQLYTFKNEVVLDPFMGSGTAGIAAVKAERHYVGYEINKDYVKLAEQRIKAEAQKVKPPFEKSFQVGAISDPSNEI